MINSERDVIRFLKKRKCKNWLNLMEFCVEIKKFFIFQFGLKWEVVFQFYGRVFQLYGIHTMK